MAEEKKGLKRKLKNFLVIRLWKQYGQHERENRLKSLRIFGKIEI